MKIFPVLLSVIFLISCSANKHYARHLNPGAIPPDLSKKGYTLLILKYSAKKVEKTKLPVSSGDSNQGRTGVAEVC
jgi:hypothetical protein